MDADDTAENFKRILQEAGVEYFTLLEPLYRGQCARATRDDGSEVIVTDKAGHSALPGRRVMTIKGQVIDTEKRFIEPPEQPE